MVDSARIILTVNGQRTTIDTDPTRPLLDVLREDLKLTGTKYGCGEGSCGACAVLVEGRRIFSCSTSVSQVENKDITTIEGLANGDALHPAQQAFLEANAFQCGYCTPGMILATAALLSHKNNPTDREIANWMNGHLCRCCGYGSIKSAVRRSAELNDKT